LEISALIQLYFSAVEIVEDGLKASFKVIDLEIIISSYSCCTFQNKVLDRYWLISNQMNNFWDGQFVIL
jgi:hypothetical protein